MHLHRDERGTLLPLEFSDLPFTPCRAFIVSEVPTGKVRGRHAHRDGDQFLVCLAGRVLVDMRYQERHEQCVLEDGSEGLFIGSGVWAQQTYLEEGSMLLVFASVPYERDVLLDIRDLSAN
jgi:dTDP-4-dehydrorhamnose 3,5-epimerase-like enzyme